MSAPLAESVLWPSLDDKGVLLAVSGGVAAYKAAQLCRLLQRAGADVRVMLTEAGQQFVGQATFAALTGNQVSTDLFDPVQEAQIGHIHLADQADVLIAAPATADLIARFAHGVANDLVSTVYLAYRGPVLIAPAMNVQMWEHPATQANVRLLHERGNRFVGPEVGEMACGHVGAGRMAEAARIVEAIGCCIAPDDLRGVRALVSAGPTHEAIDAVRYLSNRSSGKMGYAIAAELAARGGQVRLISGPTSLPRPLGVTLTRVESATQMAEAVAGAVDGIDVVIMAAAVADYRPQDRSAGKLKKADLGDHWQLALERTTDIVAKLAQLRTGDRPVLVAFAAEAGPVSESRVRDKLARKDCDILVVNDIAETGAGFAAATNRVSIYGRGGALVEQTALMTKRAVAARVVDTVVRQLAPRSEP